MVSQSCRRSIACSGVSPGSRQIGAACGSPASAVNTSRTPPACAAWQTLRKIAISHGLIGPPRKVSKWRNARR